MNNDQIFVRRKKLEEELQQMLWKVKYEELEFTKRRAGSVVSHRIYQIQTLN